MTIKFGTSGWRGIISDDFTFENVKAVAQAIAEHLKEREEAKSGVIVGRDTRFMTERYAAVVAEVLTGNGIKVYMPEGPVPTPVISFTILNMQLDGGVNITASHNPPEYCGIKFNPSSGGPALPNVTRSIEEKIARVKAGEIPVKSMPIKEAASKGLFEIIDPYDDYYKKVKETIDFERIKSAGITVVVDLMYSAAIGYLDPIIREIAAGHEIIHDFRDPYFGGGRPEPDESRMRTVVEIVRDRKWMVGIAVDGDADRFGIVDDEGDFIKPNEVIALLAEHLYKNKGLKGPVARSIATSNAIDAVARSFGEDVMETPVGFKFLGPLLMQNGAVIAGEESGGLSIQKHTPEKDGLIADLLVLEMIAYEGKPLSKIRKDFVKKYGNFHNTRLDIALETPKDKEELMEKFRHLKDEFAGMKIVKRDEIDGVRYTFEMPDTWLLARPSGTEPLIRVYVESTNLKVFRKLVSGVRKIVQS